MADERVKLVLPGDSMPLDILHSKTLVGSGVKILSIPGIKVENGQSADSAPLAVFSRCGLAKLRTVDREKNAEKSAVFLHYRQKRYAPVKDDLVLGQITQKTGEFYKLEIGCAEMAVLPSLSFDGATKRNRPNIKVGDLIFGRLVQTIEPEVSCVGKDGVSNRCFGCLPAGGLLLRLNANVAYKLKSKDFTLLKDIGKEIPYEICIGENGWVWIKAHNVRETVFIAKMIENCEYLAQKEVSHFVKKVVDEMKGFID